MENIDLIIRNCKLVIPKVGVVQAGIAVDKGIIVAIAADANLPTAQREIDAGGNYIFPGAIDTHTHYGCPHNLKEDEWVREWTYASRASVIGGVTTAINLTRGNYMYPWIGEGVDKKTEEFSFMDVFEKAKDLAEKYSIVDFRIALALMNMNQINEVPEYSRRFGVSNFKVYRHNQPQVEVMGKIDAAHLFAAFEQISRLGYPALTHVHCENDELCNAGQERMRRSGRTDNESWYDSTPPVTEAESTASTVMLAEAAKARLLVIHITAGQALEALARGKATNPELYGETCPHYLIFTKDMTEEVYPGIARNLLSKALPPVRAREDVERLWEGIFNGEIDVIGSDHVHWPKLEWKTSVGTDIWNFIGGIASGTFCLPVILSEGVNKRGLPIERAAEVTSYNAARMMGLYPQKGTIAVGSDADFAIVDMDKIVVVKPETLQSDVDFSLWDGVEFKGWPVTTILRGQITSDRGQIVGKPGTGKYLLNV